MRRRGEYHTTAWQSQGRNAVAMAWRKVARNEGVARDGDEETPMEIACPTASMRGTATQNIKKAKIK